MSEIGRGTQEQLSQSLGLLQAYLQVTPASNPKKKLSATKIGLMNEVELKSRQDFCVENDIVDLICEIILRERRTESVYQAL